MRAQRETKDYSLFYLWDFWNFSNYFFPSFSRFCALIGWLVRGSDGGGKEEGLQQHPQHQARQEERGGGRGRTNEGIVSVKSRRKERTGQRE